MIIWFDSKMQMHVDKNASANNDFALAKYGSSLTDVVFLGNVRINGFSLTFTHFHVKSNAEKVIGDYWFSQSTIRKHFLKSQIFTIEKAIAKHLKGNNYRRTNFNINFEVSNSSKPLFSELGYTATDFVSHGSTYYGDSIDFNMMSKIVEC